MDVPAWLRIWKYLQKNIPDRNYDSMTLIMMGCGVSWTATLLNLGVLDDIGLINLKREGRRTQVILTQKFFDTIEFYQELYDAIEIAGVKTK